jgi:indole-3-glycerol phosphate synthase
MDILDQIVAYKRVDVAERKQLFPIPMLEKATHFQSPTTSLKSSLIDRSSTSGIIAEFKRKSPSKGILNSNASVGQTTMGYVQAGASALSILTDTKFFGGSNEDLMTARKNNSCPILRKEFIVDEYQIIEAKSIGADAILLIAAVVDSQTIQKYTRLAQSLGLEVLLEVHDEEEVRINLDSGVDIIGVNNRNLKTFEVSMDTSRRLASLIPDTIVKISESGIDNPAAIQELRDAGYQGFLLGQVFMQQNRPEVACEEFMDALRKVTPIKTK